MTISPLHPQSDQDNAHGPVVAAFLHALSEMQAGRMTDSSVRTMYNYAAFEGMMDTVADEAISTDAHAALAIAAALWRVQDISERHRRDEASLDAYDLVALDRVQLTLQHLWEVSTRPDVLAPIAEHFALRMP